MMACEDRDPLAPPHCPARLAHRREHAEARFRTLLDRWRESPTPEKIAGMGECLIEFNSIAAALADNSAWLVRIMRSGNPGMAELVAAVDDARARHATAEAARIDAEIDRRARGATGP
jgi:hypothetical protein